MQNTINERLKILVEALDTNQNALAVLLGISPSTFRNYTDRSSKPGYEILEKLYHSFKHINLYWLFGEPGSPLLIATEERATINQTQKKNKGTVIGNIAGGATFTTLADCARENEHLRTQVELLKSQLVDKQEIIDLLKQTK